MLSPRHLNPRTQHIYEIRYQAYLAKESIEMNKDGTFTDPYDDAPNCHSHVEYIEGVPAGAIRACVYDPNEPEFIVPAQELFPNEVDSAIGADKCFVESNKFVVHPQFQNKAIRLKFALFRFVFDMALRLDADFILTSPRATQVDFYKSMLFKPISETKRSLALNFDVVLMACDLRAARHIVQTNPKYATLRRFGLC